MNLLAIAMQICSVLWCAAIIFFIYSIGKSILDLNFQLFLTGALLALFATIAQVVVAILNE